MNLRTQLTRTGIVLGAAALVSLTACAEKPTEHPFPQAKPQVTITGMQISGGKTRVFASGTDEDGMVRFYRFKFDNLAQVDSVTSSIYETSITYASMAEEHTVNVWCVDNDGLASDPAVLKYTLTSIGAANRTPETELVSPRPGAVAGPGLVVVWSARDPDGSIAGYQVRFDDDASWTAVSEVTYEKTGLAPGSHVVQARSQDNLGLWDPTPATVAFSVDTTIKPDLSTTGVTDGATFFVPPGGTVDIRVGWHGDADYYSSRIVAYAYDFNGTGISEWTTESEHTFPGIGAGDYWVTVYAKDLGGAISSKTITFHVIVPPLNKEVLVVNGIDWGTYSSPLQTVFPVFLAGTTPWDYWDLFATPAAGYPAGMNVTKHGNGAMGGDIIGQYKAILWHGNHFSGDLDFWNPDLMAGYVKAGGKVLLHARRTIAFFNDELQSMAHITGFLADLTGSFTTLKATTEGTAIGMQDVAFPAGNSLAGGITGTDGSNLVEVLFVNGATPSQILGVRAKAKDGDPWNIIVICGRQYRANPPGPMRDNYRKLLADVFGVTIPALP